MAQKTAKHAQAANNSIKSKDQKADPGLTRVLLDGDGHICFMGKDLSKKLSYKHKKNTIQSALDIFDFEDSEQVFHDTGQALFGLNRNQNLTFSDTFQDGTHKVRTPQGKALEIFFNRIKTEQGTFIVGNIIDDDSTKSVVEELTGWISQTLPTNEDTQENSDLSNEDIQNFLQMTNEVMVSCHKNGSFRNVSKKFYETFGYTQDQLPSLQFMDIIAPEDRGTVRPILIQMKNGDIDKDQIVSFETRIVCNNGERRWVEWRQKKLGSNIFMVGQDLTRLKQQQAILENQKYQLSEAQAIGRMGHWTWHLHDHSVEWSKEIFRILGVDEKTYEPKIDNITKAIHRRDLGRIVQSFQRSMIDKKDFELEFRIKRPEGDTRYIRCQGRCRMEEDDEVTALFGIMQDITDRHEYETELMQAKDSAERAYATKSQFLANMSHELRTPLNAIIGFSEMIQQQLLGPIGTEKYLDYVSGIRESGEHLLDLITDILDMSKIEAGKYELDIEKVKIHDVLDMALHMMESRALDDNIKLVGKWKKETKSPVIKVDRRAVMQIALNIISNAVKFSDKDGKVTAECLERDNYIAIKVTDTGIGIPANKINDILRPFEQVCNQYSRNHEGSGLGLAITKELVELHGGNLFIESAMGKGTTVTIRLPIDANKTRQDIQRA